MNKQWQIGEEVPEVTITIDIKGSRIKISGQVIEVEQTPKKSAIKFSKNDYQFIPSDYKSLIDRTVTYVSFNEGSYGTGGPGFMGLTLGNTQKLVLGLWGADRYLQWNGQPIDKRRFWTLIKDRKIVDFDISKKMFQMQFENGTLSFQDFVDDYFALSESDDLRNAFILVPYRYRVMI